MLTNLERLFIWLSYPESSNSVEARRFRLGWLIDRVAAISRSSSLMKGSGEGEE